MSIRGQSTVYIYIYILFSNSDLKCCKIGIDSQNLCQSIRYYTIVSFKNRFSYVLSKHSTNGVPFLTFDILFVDQGTTTLDAEGDIRYCLLATERLPDIEYGCEDESHAEFLDAAGNSIVSVHYDIN